MYNATYQFTKSSNHYHPQWNLNQGVSFH